MEPADSDKEFCTSGILDSGICMSPAEALGQSGSSWLFFSVKIMLTMMCVVLGICLFWMKRRWIQLEGQLGNDNGDQHGGAEVLGEDGSESGETNSQSGARYQRDPMCEVSDPELWQQINHGDGEDSESDVSMATTSQPHDPYASTVIEAFDRGSETIRNLTIC